MMSFGCGHYSYIGVICTAIDVAMLWLAPGAGRNLHSRLVTAIHFKCLLAKLVLAGIRDWDWPIVL